MSVKRNDLKLHGHFYIFLLYFFMVFIREIRDKNALGTFLSEHYLSVCSFLSMIDRAIAQITAFTEATLISLSIPTPK